ncbi:hypothetical protein SUDANB25_00009 [Streptomyces sp. SudanB25_2051]
MRVDEGCFSRRGLLRASAAGLAVAAVPAVSCGAAAGAGLAGCGEGGETVPRYREVTGGSVTASRDGSVLIVEVQGVLWRVPPQGGTAARITEWELEATRPALSPDGATPAVGGYPGGGGASPTQIGRGGTGGGPHGVALCTPDPKGG